MLPDPEACYRAVRARDPRFDGWFFTAVRTTGIYCRPSCPAITPKRANVEFHPSAAAAQRAGFRACKRCRPDASPGSPEWDVRGDLAGRALRLIGDGVVDRDGVPGLAARLGYSSRQVTRTLLAEVGAGPLALARAQRAHAARVLLETTDLPIADIAFAAGFSSVRQFNDTVQALFATTPSGLRAAGRGRTTAHDPGTIVLRLAHRLPMSLPRTFAFLAARAVPGVEAVSAEGYARMLRAPGGPARITVSAAGGEVHCRISLTDHRDLVTVVARVRRLLDLDADPVAVDELLGADPVFAPLVATRPGLRSPGACDGFELAVRAVIGQQISVRAARTVLGRLARQYAAPTDRGAPLLLFPGAEDLAAVDPALLPMPRSRARTVRAVAEAFVNGALTLDAGADRDQEQAGLLALPGIGRWTADYLRMRALGDPDVLLAGDLGVRRSARCLGVDLSSSSDRWRPWRSYATHHLWAASHR